MDEQYPRILNGAGCLFGQHLSTELAELKRSYKERMRAMEKKLDRLTWAAFSVAIALMTASLTLWITHLGP